MNSSALSGFHNFGHNDFFSAFVALPSIDKEIGQYASEYKPDIHRRKSL